MYRNKQTNKQTSLWSRYKYQESSRVSDLKNQSSDLGYKSQWGGLRLVCWNSRQTQTKYSMINLQAVLQSNTNKETYSKIIDESMCHLFTFWPDRSNVTRQTLWRNPIETKKQLTFLLNTEHT